LVPLPVSHLYDDLEGAAAPHSKQAAGVFVGLRRLGKEAELREYEGEGHWTGMWSEPAYRDLAERMPAWLDEHLGGTPDEGWPQSLSPAAGAILPTCHTPISIE
jgi:hypothetical protein